MREIQQSHSVFTKEPIFTAAAAAAAFPHDEVNFITSPTKRYDRRENKK
jgi:hypothetical protein